jgi:EAL domain-containing protein (putative c-di-GMP-specific phosphodiesterase class I)
VNSCGAVAAREASDLPMRTVQWTRFASCSLAPVPMITRVTWVSRTRRRVGGGVQRAGDHINRHFAAVSAVALVLAIGGLIAVAHVLVSAQLRATEERGATKSGVVLARSAFQPAVAADSDRLTSAEIDALDDATKGARTAQGVLGLTVYAPDGMVLYSPNRRLIGTHENLDRYERAALAGHVTNTPRHITTDLTDGSSAPRIDVYVPLATRAGQVVALFELTLPYAPIASEVASEARRLDLTLLVSGLLIFLLTIPRLRRAGAALRTIAAQEHRALVRDLGRAIEDGQLRLEYQPLGCLDTGHVRSVEALLRWDHPQRGLVPPADFIPQAEQTALIWPLTEHVLRQAIHQASVWHEDGLDLRVAVNIAGPCLLDHRLADTLADLLHRAQLPADRLAIELTEESVMGEPEAAIHALLTLRSLGVQTLALDDFGTGYSSLTRLRDLPFTELKIDRSFVVDAGIDGDPTLIAAIADLAHKFGLDVVAEGIEDGATWRRMATLGCDIGQGYWLSRPLRPENLPDWMREHSSERQPQSPAAVENEHVRRRPNRHDRMPRAAAVD